MEFDTMIIEEEAKPTHDEPTLEKRTQSLLCAVRFHRFTRWNKPFSKNTKMFEMFSGNQVDRDYLLQQRECKGCGLRQERVVTDC